MRLHTWLFLEGSVVGILYAPGLVIQPIHDVGVVPTALAGARARLLTVLQGRDLNGGRRG